MLRQSTSFLIGILFAFLLTTCKQYTEDIEKYLDYWASESSVTRFSINSTHYQNSAGITCLPSDRDAAVILKVQNPKNFTFVMPNTASNAADIIRFPGLPSQPSPGTDYTLRQIDSDTLELTYKSAFLKKYEWGAADIGSVITLKNIEGRQFSQTFSMHIEVNTPPPEITEIKLAKTASTPAYYVVCCKVDGARINDPVNGGGKLHGDIAAVRVIKENGAAESIPIQVNTAGTDFDLTLSGGKLLPVGSVAPLFSSAPSYALPSGTWVAYVKTDIPVEDTSALPRAYGIQLADAKRLMSGAKGTRTLGYIVDTSNPAQAWKKVKQAVETAHTGGVITLNGTITATNAPGNHGHIEISKNLTVQGVPGNPPAVLDAHDLGPTSSSTPADSHRIFTITGAVDVTLKNLTLQNGKDATESYRVGAGGGGIWAEGHVKLSLIDVTVKDCISKASGGGIRCDYDSTGGGSLTMIHCTIKDNTVKDDSAISSSGGGISLPNCPFTAVIDGCTISGNVIDKSAYSGTSTPLKAKGCGLTSGNKSNSITVIKGHTVIENNKCQPHASITTHCQGMGIWMQGGRLIIGETGKSDADSPEIRQHWSLPVAGAIPKGTALYLEGSAAVDWLSGTIHDNGLGSPNVSSTADIVLTNGSATFNNQSGNSPS